MSDKEAMGPSACRTHWRGLKVGDEHITRIVAMAVADPTAGGNPRLFDKRAARTIFKRALEGRI
jgi:alcohol dehydrogenase class IV